MSDDDLAFIRQKKLREFQRRMAAKESQPEKVNADSVLNKIFKDRAWEVFNAATYQYPEAMRKIKDILVKLASTGKLAEVTGEELYVFLNKLGLEVRLNTKITFASHGELKSLEEKMKEELRKN
jgi:DNA-binding TFAR19-related protein (PDSD5 family)